MENLHRTRLERLDIITFEAHLTRLLQGILPHESYSFLFPRQKDAACPTHEKHASRVLLPLPDGEGRVLGVFVARGADPDKADSLVHIWPAIAPVISENLLHYKRSLSDPVTGLYTRHYLLAALERAMESLRGSLPGNSAPALPQQTAARKIPGGKSLTGHGGLHGSVGIMVLRLAALRDVVREYGYKFADTLMVSLADTLLAHCPEQAIAARTGDSEFALALPSASRNAVAKLAQILTDALSAVRLEHPLRRERIGITASAGYVLHPLDTNGSLMLRPEADQARLLLRKARLAAALADEQCCDWNSAQRVMGYGNILSEGGRILDSLPFSRIVVSLGAAMQAREGQRFSVWSIQNGGQQAGQNGGRRHATPLYKGEISLMDVHENTSLAEVLHLGDPAWNLEAGDRLVLLPPEQGTKRRLVGSPSGTAAGDEQAVENKQERLVRRDPETDFLRYGDFLSRWAELREKTPSFLLALLRFSPLAGADEETDEVESAGETEGTQEAVDKNEPDRALAEAADLVRELFGQECEGGRYGLNSLVVYHTGMNADEAATRYANLATVVQERLRMELAVGIASHPFLDYRKGDALDNCLKALEYARLLPAPHVGVLDTLALNISADKKFSQGDTFAAIKEYKLALLADESNSLAWNSLGICLASLGRQGEAEQHFTSALEHSPEDIMALYNLGHVCQSSGDTERATAFFKKCLEHSPDHIFAHIRLGQIAEQAGDIPGAQEYFEKAASLPGGKKCTYRHFARLALARGNMDLAREYLHSALIHDPQDALALQALAGLCLDAGEDPDMAASLARQSVSLKPDLTAGWRELARALEMQGRQEEARQARLRASEG